MMRLDPLVMFVIETGRLSIVKTSCLFIITPIFYSANFDVNRATWGEYECHFSCENCDPATSCKEGMTCYLDYLFVEFLVNTLVLELKVDPSKIHVTGLSNGAQACKI